MQNRVVSFLTLLGITVSAAARAEDAPAPEPSAGETPRGAEPRAAPGPPAAGLLSPVGADVAWADLAHATASLDALAALGLGWLRVEVRWDRAQPAADRSDDEALRVLCDGARARGLEVFLSVWGTPAWAVAPDPQRPAGSAPPGARPEGEAWYRFLQTAARRYGPVAGWELWRRPDDFAYWRPGREDFPWLFGVGLRALRGAAPGAPVYAPALDGGAVARRLWLVPLGRVHGRALAGWSWTVGAAEPERAAAAFAGARGLAPWLRGERLPTATLAVELAARATGAAAAALELELALDLLRPGAGDCARVALQVGEGGLPWPAVPTGRGTGDADEPAPGAAALPAVWTLLEPALAARLMPAEQQRRFDRARRRALLETGRAALGAGRVREALPSLRLLDALGVASEEQAVARTALARVVAVGESRLAAAQDLHRQGRADEAGALAASLVEEYAGTRAARGARATLAAWRDGREPPPSEAPREYH